MNFTEMREKKDNDAAQVREQINMEVYWQIDGQVNDQVWWQVGRQVWWQVGRQVWRQVYRQVNNLNKGEFYGKVHSR